MTSRSQRQTGPSPQGVSASSEKASKLSKSAAKRRRKAASSGNEAEEGGSPGGAFFKQNCGHVLNRADGDGFVTTIEGKGYVISEDERSKRSRLRRLHRSTLKELQLARMAAGVGANDLKSHGLDFDFQTKVKNQATRSTLKSALRAHLEAQKSLLEYTVYIYCLYNQGQKALATFKSS